MPRKKKEVIKDIEEIEEKDLDLEEPKLNYIG